MIGGLDPSESSSSLSLLPSDARPAGTAALAVVVVHFGELASTRECLESLGRAQGVEPLLVVVNNGHPEAGRALRREFPGVEVLDAGGDLGYGAACNLGISRLGRLPSPPRSVLLLNDDCVVPPETPACLARFLDQHPEVAAVAPKIVYRDQPGRLWAAGGGYAPARALAFNRGQGERDQGRYQVEEDLPFLSGCAFCARLDAFDRGGPFDEDFFLVAEDAELCARWRRAGLRLRYLPQALVLHQGSANVGSQYDPVQSRMRYRNRLLLARKTLSRSGWAMFLALVLPLVVLRDLARHALLGRIKGFGAALAGLAAYFAGERGRPPDIPEHAGPPDDLERSARGPAPGRP